MRKGVTEISVAPPVHATHFDSGLEGRIFDCVFESIDLLRRTMVAAGLSADLELIISTAADQIALNASQVIFSVEMMDAEQDTPMVGHGLRFASDRVEGKLSRHFTLDVRACLGSPRGRRQR